MRPTVGVVTIVAGRPLALANLLEGLARQHQPADRIAVVRMDDTPIDAPESRNRPRFDVVDLGVADGAPLPLAAARNAGARACGDVDVLVFLDVDCIPGADLVETFSRVASAEDALVTGVLVYLPPDVPGERPWTEPGLAAAGQPHPARPVPPAGTTRLDDDHHLAWTTSLAIARRHFESLGGFDERFVGYGAEDTDFAHRAGALGLRVAWTGNGTAYHQHHGRKGLPLEHVDDIVRNANLFHELHGWFPMDGWLQQFADLGLIEFDPGRGLLARLEPART